MATLYRYFGWLAGGLRRLPGILLRALVRFVEHAPLGLGLGCRRLSLVSCIVAGHARWGTRAGRLRGRQSDAPPACMRACVQHQGENKRQVDIIRQLCRPSPPPLASNACSECACYHPGNEYMALHFHWAILGWYYAQSLGSPSARCCQCHGPILSTEYRDSVTCPCTLAMFLPRLRVWSRRPGGWAVRQEH